MTKKIKNVKLLLYICLATFLLNSCTEEREFIENNSVDLKFEQKSFKDLVLLKDFNKAYQKVKMEKQKSIASRSALEDEYNFTIKESEKVKIVEVDNKKFYNILIERDSSSASYFENLVFMVEKINNEDEISAYILKYGTPNGYMQFDYNGDKKVTPLFERISMYCYKVCITQCHDLRPGTIYEDPHAPGATCNNQSLIVTNCYSTCDSQGGTQPGMGNTTTNGSLTGGTTQNTGSGSNGSTEIVTAPVITNSIKLETAIEKLNSIKLDSTFTSNQKINCVYEKLLANNTFFKDMIQNNFGSKKTTVLKLKVGTISTGENAITKPYINSNGLPYGLGSSNAYVIEFDSTFINNTSTLDLANLIMHEVIHAELTERCLQLGLLQSIAPDGSTVFSDNPTFPLTDPELIFRELVYHYANFDSPTSEWNHDLFNVLNYREKLEQALLNIHPILNDPSNDFLSNVIADTIAIVSKPNTLQELMYYNSWVGLEGTTEYNTAIGSIPLEVGRMAYSELAIKTKYTHNCID